MSPSNQDHEPLKLGTLLEDNVQFVLQALGNSSDIKIRHIRIDLGGTPLNGAILHVDGLSNLHQMLQSLLTDNTAPDKAIRSSEQLLEYYKVSVISEGSVADVTTMQELLDSLLSGNSILLVDHCSYGLSVGTKDLKARSVEEPNVQSVVRGPREGFTEVLTWNTAMIRRKIASHHLWIESMKIGEVTKTETAIIYLDHLVNEDVLSEVRRRMSEIDIDGILESNYIEEYIQDKHFSPFPTVFNTERPDVVAAGLMEGRVAILVDGTPFALLVPAVFIQFFQSSEDYYQRSDFATLIRLLRFVAFVLAMLTPSFYIAISTFHQEMLPTTLLYNLASQREGVPFPAFVEALLMELTFEILREASVRMPRTVGQSISIVGTLVIGQAAVEAGLVSAAMVIVVSITAISNFVLPAFNLGIAARIVRFALMLLAASFGLFGIFVGLIMVVLHLCSLSSFGISYMGPLAPFRRSDQKDSLMRVTFPRMFTRPKILHPRNLIRQKRR
ncbi:spore germination protein [Paenibacillus doosanensis]|uniref:spore germination protein n=1 Tax=Paenibacillus doosanensis TaxID=1229154 RepID=UPI00217FCD41|nr:spore germination protein [Paenibacillus doosanensis]MCS7462040.1 spore germination protein [Paenibacillus doosanensis]